MNYITSNICRITNHIHNRLTTHNYSNNNPSLNISHFQYSTSLEKWSNDINNFNNKNKFTRSFLPFGLALFHYTPEQIRNFY